MSETKRKIVIIVVLLLVVVFGVGQFFTASVAPANQSNTQNQNPNQTPPTQVIAYEAVQPISSTPVEKGSCFASSIAAPYRADAWRCMVGNSISDPCFMITGSSSTLLCGANPAGTDVSGAFVLNLTKSLPKAEISSGTVPTNWAWRLELADGTVCSPFTGTLPFAATGEAARYSCNVADKTKGMDLIFGELNNSNPTWTAEIGALSTATSTFPPAIVASATVPVFAVWQ